ncbi:fumarylacetoacetate hydrolase family protein [uncultured Erythrobacter sp.]|uniref:fumarylacetoacetate hydrolase family protein n=1 Tax=uncultured Erythrobacter sp. TaxID=263913 RepID=UPI002636CA72|nr:fumarylacetoacetate hydrolase family protein [uncultured Erythrobacter sp.]
MIPNLALGIMGTLEGKRVVARVDDFALDLFLLAEAGLLPMADGQAEALLSSDLKAFISLGKAHHRAVYEALANLRATQTDELIKYGRVARDVELLRPLDPGDFTDFYANRYHAARSAKLTGDPDFLPEAWDWMPLCYHARTASLLGHGSQIIRPTGWLKGKRGWGHYPSRVLDFEIELGFILRQSTQPGERLRAADFDDDVFGCAVVIDWSARDLQSAEAKPLGPFHAKAFATQIGNWVVPVECLALSERPAGDLRPNGRMPVEGALFDVSFEAHVRSAKSDWAKVAKTSLLDMAWTPAEMMAHLTQSGAPVRAGDLFASGTISGRGPDALGCLIERKAEGLPNLPLGDGSDRAFLCDGDSLRISAFLDQAGNQVPLDEVQGVITPAKEVLETA